MAIVNVILYLGLIVGAIAYLLASRLLVRGLHQIPRGARSLAFLWALLFAGMGLWFGRLESPMTLAEVDASATLQVASILIALLVVLYRLVHGASIVNLKSPLLMFSLYAFVGVVAAPLSVFPSLSLFKAGSLLVVALLATAAIDPLWRRNSGKVLLNISYYYLAALVYLALIGGVLYPELTHRSSPGVLEMMLGGWPVLNPNSLSSIAAIVAIVGFRRAFERRSTSYKLFHAGLFITGLCVLVLAQGRTSILGFACAMAFLVFTVRGMRSMRWVVVAFWLVASLLFILLGGLGDLGYTVSDYVRRGSDNESLRTLTGRTDIWIQAWGAFLRSPLLGYGFSSADRLGISVHNSYLGVLVNSGVIGFTFWMVAIGVTLQRAFRTLTVLRFRFVSDEERFTAEISAVFIILLLRTVTGSALIAHSYSTMLLMAYWVHLGVARRHDSTVVRG